MQIVYILMNGAGILLGVYRERKLAEQAIHQYERDEDVIGGPLLYLYEVHSDQVNKFAGNKFKCIWMSNSRNW